MKINCNLTKISLMFRILLLALISFLLSLPKQVSAQRNELSFTTENDAFLLQYHDAYYTNGFMLQYNRAAASKKYKKIQSLEIGQQIYTPVNREIIPIKGIDRPYCGYLYLKFQETRFFQNNGFLRWSASLGLVGKQSGGESLQNSYHSLFKYKKFQGWDYQVNDATSFNLGILMAPATWQPTQGFKAVPIIKANWGNAFVNAGAGAMFALGIFEQNHRSTLWNARVYKGDGGFEQEKEWFIYAQPEWTWQDYNATLQGVKNAAAGNAILADPLPWVFHQSVGLCYAKKAISFKAAWVYQSRETKTQVGTQQYLSLQFNYRF
jgi:lipid A 3-O-deacylase